MDSYHQGRQDLCVDVGCGHGVVARSMAPYFRRVIGVDPSAGMVEQAKSLTPAAEFASVEFRAGSAERLAFLASGSVDTVVAGQAAHWFDFGGFFAEARRLVRRSGTLAVWGYSDHVFVDFPAATQIMHRRFHDLGDRNPDYLGMYWQEPGRGIVRDLMRAFKPPDSDWQDVVRREYEPATNGPASGSGERVMHKRVTLKACKQYVRTFSAYHAWKEAHPGATQRSDGGHGDVVDFAFDDMALAEGWTDEDFEVDMEWGTAIIMARRK